MEHLRKRISAHSEAKLLESDVIDFETKIHKLFDISKCKCLDLRSCECSIKIPNNIYNFSQDQRGCRTQIINGIIVENLIDFAFDNGESVSKKRCNNSKNVVISSENNHVEPEDNTDLYDDFENHPDYDPNDLGEEKF